MNDTKSGKFGVTAIVLALIIGFAGGFKAQEILRTGHQGSASEQGADNNHGESHDPKEYTCSMHPQIRLPDSDAKCPICFMALIEVEEGGKDEELAPRELRLSENARALAQIQTETVIRDYPVFALTLSGTISFNERNLKTISAWTGGRIEHLYADNVGINVRKGDKLFSLYSPDIYSAQTELIEAVKNQKRNSNLSPMLLQSRVAALEASREKLKLLGLTESQIRAVERAKKGSDTIVIKAPSEGTVIEKPAFEGMYVKRGSTVFKVADLTSLWVILDVYEKDLAFVRYGQTVSITTESYGHQSFDGLVSFISPILDEKTRTVPIRVIVDNKNGKLKPGMFVRASLQVRLGANGEVIYPAMKGKWISPRHPEIVKDKPGDCPRCGIDLVSAEELGYVSEEEGQAPLLVPATAPLITGERAVVYRQVKSYTDPVFEGVDVVLGPKAGKNYLVLKGLDEGDEVVTNGNFKLDSALQILARPSMMVAPPVAKELAQREKVSLEFIASLTPLYEAYFDLQESLADDLIDGAAIALAKIDLVVSEISTDGLNEKLTEEWLTSMEAIVIAQVQAENGSADEIRSAFYELSLALSTVIEKFGHSGFDKIIKAFCPMARNNTGAHWFQRKEEIANPYFGHQMLLCGERTFSFDEVK